MSRWKCNKCKLIIDNRIYEGNNCPKCNIFDPDEEWTTLSIDACEAAWYKQENKQLKEDFLKSIEYYQSLIKELRSSLAQWEGIKTKEDNKI